MEKIELSIVIPAYNEEKDIEDCLNSIASQDYSGFLFEVIIVDNYSTDNTVKLAKSFSNKINIKIIKNRIKDAEVSKKIGYDNAKGKYFMYLDADMRFADKDFIKKMLFPFKDDKKIAGNFVRFRLNRNHPPLTRAFSYDEFQRDPILRFFTVGIKDVVVEKKQDYWLCKCKINNIPPQGLMVYKKDLIKDYIKDKKQLIDNEIPAVLVENGFYYFAYVHSTGVEHLLLRSLPELWHKRIRNLRRTYYSNIETRKFRWLNFKKDWPKAMLWMIYTNSIVLPVISALYKTIKYKDTCFLSEPMLNIVSTYSMVYGVLARQRLTRQNVHLDAKANN